MTNASPEGHILIPLDKYVHEVTIILGRQDVGKLYGVVCRKVAAAAKAFLRFHIVKLLKFFVYL